MHCMSTARTFCNLHMTSSNCLTSRRVPHLLRVLVHDGLWGVHEQEQRMQQLRQVRPEVLYVLVRRLR